MLAWPLCPFSCLWWGVCEGVAVLNETIAGALGWRPPRVVGAVNRAGHGVVFEMEVVPLRACLVYDLL